MHHTSRRPWFNNRGTGHTLGLALALPLLLLLLFSCTASAEDFAPPPLPEIAPVVSDIYPEDADGNRVADALESRLYATQSMANRAAGVTLRAAASLALEQMTEVELVFTGQVTQSQIDTFLAMGGEITYMYKALSYGWNGRIPLKEVGALPLVMGANLVLLQETRETVLHLDTATRTGRVRPVWAAGFAGNAAGFDGDSTITIAIVDTGVDGSHTDLTGRQQYWKDFTGDGNATAVDMGGHGSHVSGIACGTGAASGSATGTLYVTDSGNLTSVASGNFFPAPLDLPTTSITYSSTAVWLGGGSTTLYQLYHAKGGTGGWTAFASANGVSPLTLTNTVTGSATNAYCPGLLSNGGTVTQYAVTSTIPSYPAVGDGFNKLRGVAPACKWAGAKVFNNAGSGVMSWTTAALDDLVANRAANNIKVINMSLGTVGDPGLDSSSRQKTNNAVANGIVVCCSAGNDGGAATAAARQSDDPGRAALAITVAASNDVNAVTSYSSEGFPTPGSIAGQEEDYKPDLVAPGGSSSYYTSILSVDSNSNDGASLADQRANDYTGMQGTSMASPFVAGCAALVIDAMQQAGTTWTFTSSQQPLQVKMLLCATATETNANRETAVQNPTLNRATAPTDDSGFPVSKDMYEGYGILNPDAAVEAVSQTYVQGGTATTALGPAATDRRAWARKVNLYRGWAFNPSLTVPAGADFDLYLYSGTPSGYGAPIILASSTNTATGATESINFTPPDNMTAILVVKRVSGSGSFSLTSTGDSTAPTGTVSINGGAAYTNTDAATLTLAYGDGTGSGVAQMRFSNDNSTWSTWEAAAATKAWTLSAAGCVHTVYAQFKDAVGNVSTGTISDTTIFDMLPPVITLTGTTPVTLACGSTYADAGATATDSCAGSRTANIVVTNPVNTAVPGTYTVRYNVSDGNGNNAAEVTRYVNVVDTVKPVITLSGQSFKNVVCGYPYTDDGATATDTCAGNLTANLVVTNPVNTSVPGMYTVRYNVNDGNGNSAVELSRTVAVTDSAPPTVIMYGPSPAMVNCGGTYTDAGVVASDVCAGDRTANIVTTGTVNTAVPGMYTLHFNVNDGNGNSATEVQRTVNVVDVTPPVITLIGSTSVAVACGTTYADAGATAVDSCTGSRTASIVVTNPVNTALLGAYTVRYNVNDGNGNNAVEATRVVNVVDMTPPLITPLGANPATVQCGTAYTDAGATASDSCAGSRTADIQATNPVSTTVLGAYTVRYNVNDGNGNNAVEATRVVNVVDTAVPLITLLGSNPANVQCGAAYTDAGATAVDSCTGDRTGSISVTNPVNTAVLGVYTVRYNVNDGNGNNAGEATRIVNVVDTAIPVITLLGSNPASVQCGAAYADAGATAVDSCAGDRTGGISVTNPVDTAVLGAYTMRYNVNDGNGNNAVEVTRMVNVVDTTGPAITPTGPQTVTIECGGTYTDAGATALDSCAGDQSTRIVTTNPVNTTLPGTYTVRYNADDGNGNSAAEASRLVTVADHTPPVVQLNGSAAVQVECGGNYADPGATATDSCAGTLSVTVSAVPQPDFGVIGVYTFMYNASDGINNAAQVTRTVTVVDTTPPEITLAGSTTMSIQFGGTYTEPGATATDGCAMDVAVTVGTTVNTALLGEQTVRYTANDGHGNSAQASRVVTVVDTAAPTGSIVINNNRSATNTPSVTLALTWNDGTGSGVTRMRFSDDGSHWTAYQALAATLPYTLPAGDAHKTVRVQYIDRANNRSAIFSDYILLDTAQPTGSIIINSGALTTSSRTVTLGMTWADGAGAGVTRMRFSDDGSHWSYWYLPQASITHSLVGATGYNTVRVQYLDGANNYSVVYSDYIKLLAP